ncbi:hypothetical protein [Falsiroseomonas oryzae]|uniref:hypothetical protein n=1 Tax=Falsiroseomonas oryzae TaxID=2766473 RepID=UPI0022EAA4CE|nr:hypothetical protein [Roseomonas sp. MO-31]
MQRTSDEIFLDVQEQYLPRVLDKVRDRAMGFAAEEGRDAPDHVDVFRAFEAVLGRQDRVEPRFSVVRENLFLIVVAAMTFIFGMLALAPYVAGASAEVLQRLNYRPDSFLDIAKLFAGVVVGGAAGAAVASSSSRRGKG